MSNLFSKFSLPLKIALKSLSGSKGRTFLTVFGIVIGIAAVIIVMSAGDSLKGLVLGQLESFGSDVIQIEPKVPTTGKNSTDNAGAMAQGVQITTLTLDDAQAISKLPNIKNYYAAVIGQDVVSYSGDNKSINFMGTSPSVVDIDKTKVEAGRFYTTDDDNQLAKVVVLGSKVANQLFGEQNPVNQDVKIGKNKFRVIGVLKERGAGFGLDFDQLVYMPIQTAQKLVMGIDYVLYITAQVKDTAIQDQTADDISFLLRERHKITDSAKDDFGVTTMAEARNMIDSIFGGITLLLVAIAGISLLVGGVGIMNIMYVSVTERTFEIGLRKAIGARRRQILWQFLFEAIVVTLLGGLVGILMGVLLSFLISLVAGRFGFIWSFTLPPRAVAIAFGFCGAVGLIFGYYPAQKAANMDPIEALRHE